ncbi:MAG: hypothetical protein ABI382_11650 [Nakamurella sp.]
MTQLRRKRRGRSATIALSAAVVVALGSAGTAAAAAAGAAPDSPFHAFHTLVFGSVPTVAVQIRGHLDHAGAALDQTMDSADPVADSHFAIAMRELDAVPPLLAQLNDPIRAAVFGMEFAELRVRVDLLRIHATPTESVQKNDANKSSSDVVTRVAQQPSLPSNKSGGGSTHEPPVSIIDQIRDGTANIGKNASDSIDGASHSGGEDESTNKRGNDGASGDSPNVSNNSANANANANANKPNSNRDRPNSNRDKPNSNDNSKNSHGNKGDHSEKPNRDKNAHSNKPNREKNTYNRDSRDSGNKNSPHDKPQHGNANGRGNR